MELFRIKDVVAKEFGPIYEAKNKGVAQRQFMQVMQDKPYPDDYKLYHVGSSDSESGWLTSVEPVEVFVPLTEEKVLELKNAKK